MARYFGLPSAQHANVVAIPDEVAFHRWVRNESRIRYVWWRISKGFSANGLYQNHECHPRARLSHGHIQQRASSRQLLRTGPSITLPPGLVSADEPRRNVTTVCFPSRADEVDRRFPETICPSQ